VENWERSEQVLRVRPVAVQCEPLEASNFACSGLEARAPTGYRLVAPGHLSGHDDLQVPDAPGLLRNSERSEKGLFAQSCAGFLNDGNKSKTQHYCFSKQWITEICILQMIQKKKENHFRAFCQMRLSCDHLVASVDN
jgi:hypothetical protein